MTEPGAPTTDLSTATTPTAPITRADFARNLAVVRARITAAAQFAGRQAHDIRLLPVSKTVPAERLRVAYSAGITQMGENKVQEALAKSEALADLGIHWTLIGHLQTNKARFAAAFAQEFQALDSLRLARALDQRLQGAGRSLEVYVQVNSSGEASKFGLHPDDVPGFLDQLADYPRLKVQGLMTLAANSPDSERVRACFRLMRQLRDAALAAGTVGPGLLSMGMSRDLELAIAEGSNCVRVGQAIFGARATPAAANPPAVDAPA